MKQLYGCFMYSLLPSELRGPCWTAPLVPFRPVPGNQRCKRHWGFGFLNLLLHCGILKWLVTSNITVLVKPPPPDEEKSGLHYSVPSNHGAFLAHRAASSRRSRLHGRGQEAPYTALISSRLRAQPNRLCVNHRQTFELCFSLELTPAICLAIDDTDWIQTEEKHFSFEDAGVIYLAISGQFLRNMIHVWRI